MKLTGPSAAARTGKGSECCGKDRLGSRALRPFTKFIERGGSKNRSLGNYQAEIEMFYRKIIQMSILMHLN